MARLAGILIAALLSSQGQPPTLAPGAAAPDFALPGVDGKTLSLKDFASAKLLCVMFTTNHCPTARYYEERIKRLVVDYADKGVALVAINPSDPLAVRPDELGYTDLADSFEDMKIRARDNKFNFPYLYDGETQAAARAYGVTATPHAFLFDSDRKLRYVGRIDDSEVESKVKVQDLRVAIDALLAGRQVEKPVTRANGCSTKWSSKRDSVVKFMEKFHQEPVKTESIDLATFNALLKEGSGKVRLVHVWAPDAASELPKLVTINTWYRGRKNGFEFVTATFASPEEAMAVLKREHASNRNVIVNLGDLKVPIRTLPGTIALAPDGTILYQKVGAIDDLELKRAIVANLK